MAARLFSALAVAGVAVTANFLAACSRAPAATVSAAAASEAPTSRPFALVELYTSEGCSSCPPADAVLRDIARDARARASDVYALSFHVDYWNELGWADPFSKAAFTARQRAYANARRERSVYTPQMIVNGGVELNGSDAEGARRAIDQALHAESPSVTLSIEARIEGGAVTVYFESAGAPSGAILSLALVEASTSSQVERGENKGRYLEHSNVVRAFASGPLDVGTGESARTRSVPWNAPRAAHEALEVVAWIQDASTMRVLAAARTKP